jgi:hypothetical protein
MENNTVVTEILNFFNVADAELMGTMPDANGKPLGTATAKRVIEERAKISKEGFTSLEQLMKIKGLGEATIGTIAKRMTSTIKYPGMTKSQTLFTFAQEAPALKEYDGRVVLEKLPRTAIDEKGNPVEETDQAEYELYYTPDVNKEQLFKRLRADANFRTEALQRTFAIQTRNNQFVATAVPNSNVYLREIFFASKFKLRFEGPFQHTPWTFASTNPNAKMTVSMETDFYGNVGLLNFNAAQNRVGARTAPAGTPSVSGDFFDISGIIGEPWTGAHPLFKSFTIMNYVQQNIPSGDPREFISADNIVSQPGSQNGLIGSNNNTEFWRRENQLRYVEIVENVAIEAVMNQSHSGPNRRFVNCGTQAGDINAISQSPNAAIPLSAKFDMFVFYGYWEERGNIACRVAFRAKQNGRFLGLKANTFGIQEDLAATHISLNELTSFYVENGWGGTVNNVNLKTSAGKYVICWQTIVAADSVNPINNEQFKIIIP